MRQRIVTETVKIEKLVPGGQGLGTLKDGKKIFLWNALPNEVVKEFLVVKEKTHYQEGIATQFLETAKERIEAKDECYLSTSPWQIFSYEYELEKKAELLREQFRQVGVEADFSESVRTDGRDFFYRNKMEYALYWDNELEEIRLAFHKRGSHQKMPIFQSSLEKPEIFRRAQEIVADLNARGEEARKYQSLLLRCNLAGEVSGGLYENHKPHPVFPKLEDEILDERYSYSPNGFFQINLPVYELALLEIKKYIETEKVLDLYSGVGTIGLSVARERDLTLVECDKSAYLELEKNCSAADIAQTKKVRPVLAKSEEVLDFIERGQTVILDPPRAGCRGELLERLLEVRPGTIIYLSCNPATQARDVKILTERYTIEHLISFNFFPRTPHLENLVILRVKE